MRSTFQANASIAHLPCGTRASHGVSNSWAWSVSSAEPFEPTLVLHLHAVGKRETARSSGMFPRASIFSWLLRYTASLCRTSTPVVYDSRFSRSWPCIASTFGGGRLNRWGNITGNRTASGVVDIRSERNFVETTLFSKLARMKFNKGSAVCLWSTVPVHFNNCFG